MQIHGPTHIHGPQPINAPHRAPATAPAAGAREAFGADEVEFSHEAELVSRARELAQELPEIRHERVAQIRAEIAAGSYETTQKLDLAIDRLLDELA